MRGPTVTGESRQATNIAVEIIDRIAEAEDADPLALRPPLAEAIDVDALVGLLESCPEDFSTTFAYRDWLVEVRDDRTITLREQGETA